MRRPTSLREQPESSNARARLRRSSSRSALPFSLGKGVLLLNTYYCILYAEINKAKQPVVNGLRLRFVRFSGQALTQGVLNTKIDGVAVRIYSEAKTSGDCLKYRRKMGGELAINVLRESIARRKCSKQRLRHFAKICRVGKLVQ